MQQLGACQAWIENDAGVAHVRYRASEHSRPNLLPPQGYHFDPKNIQKPVKGDIPPKLRMLSPLLGDHGSNKPRSRAGVPRSLRMHRHQLSLHPANVRVTLHFDKGGCNGKVAPTWTGDYVLAMSPLFIEVRPLRERKGWTQAELAELAGVTRATVNRLENGHPKSIDLDVLEKLAKALGVSPGLLIAKS